MKWLTARYPSGAAFLEYYQPDFPHGGLVVPTRTRVEIGEDALVAVRFPELAGEVCLRGYVAWRRSSDPRRKLKGGVAVEFIQADGSRRDFLLRVAEGKEAVSIGRKNRRLPIELRVTMQPLGIGEPLLGATEDISRTGAFIRCGDPPPISTEIVLTIEQPSGGHVELAASVVWVRRTGRPGMGVHFTAASRAATRVLNELLRRLESGLGSS